MYQNANQQKRALHYETLFNIVEARLIYFFLNVDVCVECRILRWITKQPGIQKFLN